MDQAKAVVTRFLDKHGMNPENIDLEQICADFESEMIKGLSSYKSDSSLLMLPTFVKIGEVIPHNEPVIAIDAGGTNLRTAVLCFDRDMKYEISDFKNYPMPGAAGAAITKKEFFETIYSYLEPILDRSDKIGFCFSYAVTIMPNRDGRVIELSKEVKVDGLEGELVNENLLEVIRSHRKTSRHTIVQLNDTLATLLGGKAANPKRVFESYIGLILGTGTNTCYIEDCANIKKLSEVSLDGEQAAAYSPGNMMLINIESGSFNKAPFGDIDDALDKKMKDPGRYRFEKAMSGGYQGILMTEILKTAATEGLFSPAANAKFNALQDLESRDLDSFLYYPYGDNKLSECTGTYASSSSSSSSGSSGASGSSGSSGSVGASRASGAGEVTGPKESGGSNGSGGPKESGGSTGASGAVGSLETDGGAAALRFVAADEDARKLYYLTDALFERAAMFTAANVTAILRKTSKGTNPNMPVCVTAEGTTFYKSKLFRAKLDHHIREFTNKRNGLYCDFVKADNGVLTGAAIAALQN